ncbi:MAG: ribbon-helix-helix domain-containing protein, partial [Candidatus Kariarchaeaceae archaeon]
ATYILFIYLDSLIYQLVYLICVSTVTKEYSAVNIPMDLIKKIDKTLKNGFYSSRSEFVKDAIRRLILYYETLE